MAEIREHWNKEKNTCACGCWNEHQHEYHRLRDIKGREEARVHIVKFLRDLAQHIETDDSPWLFGAIIPEQDFDIAKDRILINQYSIQVSHPWGG